MTPGSSLAPDQTSPQHPGLIHDQTVLRLQELEDTAKIAMLYGSGRPIQNQKSGAVSFSCGELRYLLGWQGKIELFEPHKTMYMLLGPGG